MKMDDPLDSGLFGRVLIWLVRQALKGRITVKNQHKWLAFANALWAVASECSTIVSEFTTASSKRTAGDIVRESTAYGVASPLYKEKHSDGTRT